MRKILFGNRIASNDVEIASNEFGGARFALLVAYLPPRKNGEYRITLRVELRDGEAGEVAALIKAHRLRDVVIYSDAATAAADKRMAELAAEADAALDKGAPDLTTPHRYLWGLARMVVPWAQRQRTVHLTFGMLLDGGAECAGSLEEMRKVAKEVAMQIDRLSALLQAGHEFDSGGVRVLIPGSKTKPTKTKPAGTPPEEWS